jgi:hypothetical protein
MFVLAAIKQTAYTPYPHPLSRKLDATVKRFAKNTASTPAPL